MWEKWVLISWHESLLVLLSVVLVYSGIILYIRITGLRSFSKMSAPDFAMTVAVGSMLGSSVLQSSPTILITLFGIACLFSMHFLIAYLRVHFKSFSKMVDNDPMLLINGSNFLSDNMHKAQVSKNDIHAKLREANVWSYTQIIAVVFETTGDISVIHNNSGSKNPISSEIFDDIKNYCSVHLIKSP